MYSGGRLSFGNSSKDAICATLRITKAIECGICSTVSNPSVKGRPVVFRSVNRPLATTLLVIFLAAHLLVQDRRS